jgi:hypothetical protein
MKGGRRGLPQRTTTDTFHSTDQETLTMARPESIALAGYFPTPPELLPRIASLVSWPGRADHGVLLDPCAGDGDAIRRLQEIWAHRPALRPRVVACELEGERARGLSSTLATHTDQTLHADAFHLTPTNYSRGAAVLYLNPPYDHDPDHGRLEHRFLVRFTSHLAPGSGVLLFVVPHASLATSAAFLASEFTDLRAWRFPAPHFDRFGQIVLLARRRRAPLDTAPASTATVEAWAAEPERLAPLPERCPAPFSMPSPGAVHWSLRYDVHSVDVDTALAAFEPWARGETGDDLDTDQLLGSRCPVAVPMKPAYIALALAAGMFNGHRLDPDEPGTLPPLLAKGAYTREAVEIDRSQATDGTVSVTAVDRPRLRVTVLRLDDATFHTLADGTEPAGGLDLSRWTAADLLVHYGRSMARLLTRQFPPLHDPTDPGHQFALPRLDRIPFTVQEHAVRTAVKLLAAGANPIFPAEVGVGKTTMAVFVAAALSSPHHAETSRQLRGLGFERPLPLVRRTLVVCPPHLLSGWRDQLAAILPSARVQIVRAPGDLEVEADFYILSRETAKLGHGHTGLEGSCPGCGSPIPRSARSNASRRHRCEVTPLRPRNAFARLASHLATLLAPAMPEEDLVVSLAPTSLLVRLSGRPAFPLSQRALLGLRDRFLREIVHSLDDGPLETRHSATTLASLLRLLTRALGISDEDTLARLRRRLGTLRDLSSAAGLHDYLRSLESRTDPSSDPPEMRLVDLLERLSEHADWTTERPCDEPLYQAVPPRRVALARWIVRRHRNRFDLLILDEAHEFNNRHSAQAKAAHRLIGLPGVPTLALTGSLMGGYASSLFPNLHALSPAFRAEFERDDVAAFVARYGYQKVRLTVRDGEELSERGAYTDRELAGRRIVGEAPGVHPLLLIRHLLPTAIPVHKDDLDDALPALDETPVAIEPRSDDAEGSALLKEYGRLQNELLRCIRRDRFDPERSGRLLGALVELPSFLDRATDDLDPFEVRYPESVGGGLIARGRSFPAAWRTPKESWLLELLRKRLAGGERAIVFLRHTGTGLPRRLLRLIQAEVCSRAVFLDTPKVPTRRRERWIDEHVNEPEVPVLLVNPNAVRTGLNNLVGFSTAVWYELDPSAFCYRQAIGRLHRIGQTRPVSILIPYYAGTAQQITMELVAKKVTASLQVDGLDVRGALEAAGAGHGLPDGLETALSLGHAVYRALTDRLPEAA